MPTFTPINAQEVAEAQPGDVGDKAAVGVPHAHVEQQVRDCIESYSAALRLWNKGPIAEALAKLEELSTSPLISMQQDSHIETECDAYCNEYGGITMSRLRSLVFRGIGSLVIQTASRAEYGSVFQNVGTPRFEITDYELEPELAEAAHKAVASITTAIRFSQAETTTYLLLAHSAILAGCLDIATSALSSGLQASSGPVMLPELQARGLVCNMDVAGALVRQLHSPAQWWCLKTLCQVALLKGDSEMVERIATLFQDAGVAADSIPLCAEDLGKIRPAPLQLPPAPLFSTLHSIQRCTSDESANTLPETVSLRSVDGSVALFDVGQAIFGTFSRLSDPRVASNSLFREISLSVTSSTATDDAARTSDMDKPANCDDTATVLSGDPKVGVTAPESTEVPEGKGYDTKSPTTGDEEKSADADTPSGHKRRESFSGDEMPTKRRSTRFIERSTSTLAGSTPGTAGTGTLSAGNRAPSVRSNQSCPLSMKADQQGSPAYDEAKSSTEAWFRSISFGRQPTYSGLWTTSRNVARSIALYLNRRRQQQRQRQKSKDKSELETSEDVVGWCLEANAEDNSSHLCQSSRYLDSLRLLLSAQTNGDQIPAKGGLHVSEQYISVDECRRLFDGNDGVIDLLLRYYDRLCIALCSDVPAGQFADSRLSETALHTLEQVHEAIIDWTNDSLMSGMSPMDYEKAIRYGLVALQLLSGVLIRQLLPGDMYQCMRAEWIRTTDSVLQSAMREQAYQNFDLEYRIAKEWADYELAVVSNDVDLAEQHIAHCEELFDTLQTQQGDGSWMGSTKCAFSGEPVTLKLVKSRRGHIASFQALVKAESALASDKEGAARRLESIVRTFTADGTAGGYFSFVQKIAAVRLLASIYKEQSQTGNEARLVVIELFLYMERLVAECGDSDSDTASVPLRPIVGRCVDRLQRLAEIAQDDSQVWEELARMLDTAFFSTSCMQMLALSLEVAAYFSVDQPAESPLAVSPEATLSVMATWFVAKLSADIPALPVAEEFACVPPNCSDETVDEKAAVSDTGAEPTADPPQSEDRDPDSQKTTGDSTESLDKYTLLLSAVHELFGERGMCTVADGCLLKHQMAVCRKALDDDRDNLAYWDTTASCLRCLFDIKLYSSRTSVHVCEHLDMDEASAGLVYRLVEPELLDAVRSRKGTGLRSDLKAVVDQASAALGEIDVERIPHLSMNMDILDGYLDGTSMPTFAEVEQSLRYSSYDKPLVSLPLREIRQTSRFPDAFWSLPFVRATVQHDLLRSRMKSGMSRAIQDYDEVIDDFKLNVALHPTSAEAWHHLGKAFWDLSEEILLGTANEIIEQRFDVAMLQRSALSCAVQAKQYLEPLPVEADVQEKRAGMARSEATGGDSDSEDVEQAIRLHIRVISTAGNILYTIGSRPLPLLALRVLPSNVLPSDDEDENGPVASQRWDTGRWVSDRPQQQLVPVAALTRSLTKRYDSPSDERVFALAREMFALVTALDKTHWRWPYMLGKSIGKLGEFATACACYLNACYLAVSGGRPFSSTASLANAAPTVSASASTASISAGSGVPPAISHSASASLREGPAADSQYKLISSVSKLLFAGKMDPATALRFLAAMPYSPFVGGDTSKAQDQSADGSINAGSSPKPEVVAVFEQIRGVVQKMCASDKRRWHHRPCYLLAWIEHRVFGDSEAAKQTLLPLLQMRNQTKQLASFYKTDSEMPGKHYLYLEKYLLLFIDTLVATADIDSVKLLRRKLRRSSEALYEPSVLQTRIGSAYVQVLQHLVVRLNCPKYVVDEQGKEHIILQKSLEGAKVEQVYSVTRHCKLNRGLYNHARDMAMSNITHFVELSEHLGGVLNMLEKRQQQQGAADPQPGSSHTTAIDVVKSAAAAIDQYLADARRATELLELVLEEKKKHVDDAAVLGQLADMMADLFIRVLHSYGQDKRAVHPPPYQEGDAAELKEFCTRSTAMLTPAGADSGSQRAEGSSFWQDVIFDASRNESSQQYKLLDPLLEFSINRLLDAVRDAKAQKTNTFSYRSQIEVVVTVPPPPPAAHSPLPVAEHQPQPEEQQQPPAPQGYFQ